MSRSTDEIEFPSRNTLRCIIVTEMCNKTSRNNKAGNDATLRNDPLRLTKLQINTEI